LIERGEVAPLAAQQRAVLVLITRYYQATGETPSMRYLARRLDLHLKTVQQHLDALYRKGWLRSPDPGGLHCPHTPAA
jgi:DNA-binding MarR family transcriptional regulator